MQAVRQKLGKSDIALFVLVALYLGLWPLESSVQFVLSLRQLLQGFIYILGGLVLMRWVILGIQWTTRQFLWRVRHRMVAVFFFVGALPLVLGGFMVVWGTALLFGPLAAYMVTTQVGLRAERLNATADSLLWQLRASPEAQRADILEKFVTAAQTRFPSLEGRAKIGGSDYSAPEGIERLAIPNKLATHVGAVRRDAQSLLTALQTDPESGDSVLLTFPLSPEYMRRMLPGLGMLAIEVEDPTAGSGRSFLSRIEKAEGTSQPQLVGSIPPPVHPFDWKVVWPIEASVLEWESNRIIHAVLLLQTRLSAIVLMIFAAQADPLNQFALYGSYALAATFLITVLTSVIVAVSLTRTLTRTVNDLYIGTQHVNEGDFAYRVPIGGTDQVSDLSRSFNTMTASIERLVEDSKERERLEAELDIAREVQSKLFPTEAPKLETLELLGVCRPARSVSGGFYDYVRLSETRVAISFGDVSGKGISAALVMATLHSTVRTQLSLLTQIDSKQLDAATAEVVDRTNKHLCQATAADKFSTLFFSAYDEETGRLSYTNAGHLPPLLIRAGAATPLEVHGMVVGAFPFAAYESGVVTLAPGDLLVAFTDGVTEPENAYEQEFGEDRLTELLLLHADQPAEELISIVMSEVVDWTGDPTLQDDMTMLVARKL